MPVLGRFAIKVTVCHDMFLQLQIRLYLSFCFETYQVMSCLPELSKWLLTCMEINIIFINNHCGLDLRVQLVIFYTFMWEWLSSGKSWAFESRVKIPPRLSKLIPHVPNLTQVQKMGTQEQASQWVVAASYTCTSGRWSGGKIFVKCFWMKELLKKGAIEMPYIIISIHQTAHLVRSMVRAGDYFCTKFDPWAKPQHWPFAFKCQFVKIKQGLKLCQYTLSS